MNQNKTDTKILAMYDVRGIQKFIYRTAKVKDAMGASLLVENIIYDALRSAVGHVYPWCDKNGPIPYHENSNRQVEVLFIGGGNAYVLYDSLDRYKEVSRKMSRYVLDKTYSLQLATAWVEKKADYASDYQKLKAEMGQVKAEMILSRPYGSLPVMRVERKTGYPLVRENESTESKNKKDYKDAKAREKAEKIFDKLVQQKGIDSTLAVVHIDGNNMGLRILELIRGEKEYEKAVNTMRRISWQISHSFRTVFDEMSNMFNEKSFYLKEFEGKEFRPFIRRIVTAGDDITYVCTARIALATVQYFIENISRYTLNGETDLESLKTYGFSACAGIAYMGSHFPFSIAYDVAESCCENAKNLAKRPENRDGSRVASFVDFQICKNIKTRNLEKVRKNEYETTAGKSLLLRPYYIPANNGVGFESLEKEPFHFQCFRDAVQWMTNEKNIPRSFAKQLRNMYNESEISLETWNLFLKSRGWIIPEKNGQIFFNNLNKAIWYDALEMMDYYLDLNRFTDNTTCI
ncbi:MAG: Cas10/Cmr2 second palm domain-containing protein [Lachnospiraceae bacterium]